MKISKIEKLLRLMGFENNVKFFQKSILFLNGLSLLIFQTITSNMKISILL